MIAHFIRKVKGFSEKRRGIFRKLRKISQFQHKQVQEEAPTGNRKPRRTLPSRQERDKHPTSYRSKGKGISFAKEFPHAVEKLQIGVVERFEAFKLGFVGVVEDSKLMYEGGGILLRHEPFGSGGPLSLLLQRK